MRVLDVLVSLAFGGAWVALFFALLRGGPRPVGSQEGEADALRG